MQGNIICVDYERSSWRYMNYERSLQSQDLDTFKIDSAAHKNCDTIPPYLVGKGGGSAYGGNWRPTLNKPNDWKFTGNPSVINQTYNKHGELYETHIDPDSKADEVLDYMVSSDRLHDVITQVTVLDRTI